MPAALEQLGTTSATFNSGVQAGRLTVASSQDSVIHAWDIQLIAEGPDLAICWTIAVGRRAYGRK